MRASVQYATAETEMDLLQGRWALVSVDPSAMVLGAWVEETRLTVYGDEWRVRVGLGAESKFKLSLDSSQTPKTIDLTGTVGDLTSESHGIYQLDGDTLTICWGGSGDERPSEFKAAGFRTALAVWMRLKA